MISPTPNNFLRALFVAICCLLGIAIALGFDGRAWVGAIAGALFGVLSIGIDLLLGNFSFRGFSHASVGLLVGLFCAFLINQLFHGDRQWMSELISIPFYVYPIVQLCVYLLLGFLGVSLAMRSNQEEFSMIIPYVRLRQDSSYGVPILVDTSAVIDGRIEKVYDTGFFSGSLVVPRFVLDELQLLADSSDPIKRARGKRGLDVLNTMRSLAHMDVTIHEDPELKEEQVDSKLVSLARRLGARLLTNDSNLEQVAKLQSVRVLNLHTLAYALKPDVSPGDRVELDLVKEGRDSHQAVGYLPDGTMIVVNNARKHLGTRQTVSISSAVQTSAGRLIFGELDT